AKPITRYSAMKSARALGFAIFRHLHHVPGHNLKFRRFGLANYIQTDIAWGLLQLAAGEAAEGSDRLARFCKAFEIDPNSPILTKARAEALEIGNAA
ncbi:hypothetical protein, partial [Rhizobium miluonense]